MVIEYVVYYVTLLADILLSFYDWAKMLEVYSFEYLYIFSDNSIWCNEFTE